MATVEITVYNQYQSHLFLELDWGEMTKRLIRRILKQRTHVKCKTSNTQQEKEKEGEG